jgi:hypothetical protein
VLCAETLLASGPRMRPRADAHQVVVHVDAAVLASSDPAAAGPDGGLAAGRCELEDGELLDPETARRLACKASIVRILEVRSDRRGACGTETSANPIRAAAGTAF